MYLDLQGALIEIHFEHMSEFLDLTQSALDKKQKEFDAFIEEKAKQLKEEDKDHFYEWHSDDYWKFNEILPEHLYSNFIVSWFSFVESKLFDLCNYIYLNKQLASKHTELKGKGIGKAKKYISEIANIPLVADHWEELDKVRKIRNFIVHNNGEITENDFIELKPYLKANSLVKGREEYQFCPCLEYCRYLLKFGYDFFTNLFYDSGKTASRTKFARKI